MRAFRVWIRHTGDFCDVRVDSKQNAKRLLDCLSQSFVLKTFDPIIENGETESCMFHVPYNPPLSHASFVKMLTAIPEVQLMSEHA